MKRILSAGSIAFCGAIVLGVMSGCASHEQETTTVIPPPPTVPAAPAMQAEAIDPSLQAQALTELMAEADSQEPIHRGDAISSLQKTVPDKAEQPILHALNDPDPGVRFAACVAAGELRLKSAHEPLLAMVDDKDLRVQVGVRFGLHRIGDTHLSHELEQFSTNIDPQVRACTAQVLGFLGEPSAVKILRPMLGDKSLDVQLEAQSALWRLGDADARNALFIATASTHPDDQMFALLALAGHPDAQVKQYIHGQLTSDYLEVSLAAAEALGMLGSDDGWNVAVPAAKSIVPRQRALAALAMGAIGRSDLQKTLEPLLKDSDTDVRMSAAMAVLELHAPQAVANR